MANNETDYIDCVLNGIEDENARALAEELAALKPDWQSENADYRRSVAILKEFDTARFPRDDEDRIFDFLRLRWTEATSIATQLRLLEEDPRTSHPRPLGQRLGGLCLVQANMDCARSFA